MMRIGRVCEDKTLSLQNVVYYKKITKILKQKYGLGEPYKNK